MAEVTPAGRLPWHWFRARRDDGDGRDDDRSGGQKTVTIVTTVTENFVKWQKIVSFNIYYEK